MAHTKYTASIETLIMNLCREARYLREAAVDDYRDDRWIAAGERENCAYRLRVLLAELEDDPGP